MIIALSKSGEHQTVGINKFEWQLKENQNDCPRQVWKGLTIGIRFHRRQSISKGRAEKEEQQSELMDGTAGASWNIEPIVSC